jgi:hypothetical protein
MSPGIKCHILNELIHIFRYSEHLFGICNAFFLFQATFLAMKNTGGKLLVFQSGKLMNLSSPPWPFFSFFLLYFPVVDLFKSTWWSHSCTFLGYFARHIIIWEQKNSSISCCYSARCTIENHILYQVFILQIMWSCVVII